MADFSYLVFAIRGSEDVAFALPNCTFQSAHMICAFMRTEKFFAKSVPRDYSKP